MLKIIDGIVDGVIQHSTLRIYCYANHFFMISLHNKYVLERNMYIGNSWIKSFYNWRPLGFERNVLYA